MNRDEARRERDPVLWHQVRARLARIKMMIAIQQVNNLVCDRQTPNMIEQTLLGQQGEWPQQKKEVKDERANRSGD